MRSHHRQSLTRIRKAVIDADKSLQSSFGGEMPADPSAAISDLCRAFEDVADMLEALAEEMHEGEG